MARLSSWTSIDKLSFLIAIIQVSFMVLLALFCSKSVFSTEIIQRLKIQTHSIEWEMLYLWLVHGKVRGIVSLSLCSLTLQQTRLSVLFHWRLILNQIVLIISPIPTRTGKFFVFTGNLFVIISPIPIPTGKFFVFTGNCFNCFNPLSICVTENSVSPSDRREIVQF